MEESLSTIAQAHYDPSGFSIECISLALFFFLKRVRSFLQNFVFDESLFSVEKTSNNDFT